MRALRRRVGKVFRLPPPAVLTIVYLTFITIGTLLLKLPFANNGNVSWSDAAFTSTSAVTVTGLVVVDTGTAFTGFGQAVIAVLIQVGGLGLMTFAALLLTALGIKVGMPQRLILREDLNQTSMGNLATLVSTVIMVALACELVGVIALSTVFVPQLGWGGLWQAVFHTISAFNNAGFSLFSDSLSGYVANPVVNITVPALFITGGLGFVVLGDLWRVRGWRGLALHSKLMLSGTLALVIWGAAMFAWLEWSNPGTLGGLPSDGARLWAAWFQGVTPRTAGFNTLDTSAMHDETTLFTITLMLIGGGPTSTAGGIKVTTFIVLLMATVAFFRSRTELHAFGRSLGVNEVIKVMALVTIAMVVVLMSTFVMLLAHDGRFLDIAFEVASAFGTVGMSMGTTGELDDFGRALICAIMFMGRVGPLTIGFFLAAKSVPRLRYAPGQVYLG